jgi:hypothetical protein
MVVGISANATEQNQSVSTKMVLTKFQQRAIKIKKMNDAADEEARKLEEEGFCPCSVQKP